MTIKGIDHTIAGASCIAAAIHACESSPVQDLREATDLRRSYHLLAERIAAEAVRQFRAKRGAPEIPPIHFDPVQP